MRPRLPTAVLLFLLMLTLTAIGFSVGGAHEKPSAVQLLADAKIYYDNAQQPAWWSAGFTMAGKGTSVGMNASLDSGTLTVNSYPGLIYATIDEDGTIKFNKDPFNDPRWWNQFMNEMKSYDWRPVWNMAKQANLQAWVTTAHTRTCTIAKRLVTCAPKTGEENAGRYVYMLPQ